jgi:hypothetical protein
VPLFRRSEGHLRSDVAHRETATGFPSRGRVLQHYALLTVSVLAPFVALLEDDSNQLAPMANVAIVSLALLGSTAFEYWRLPLCQDISALLCGIWLGLSPHLFGYSDSGHARFWHIGLGTALAGLAIAKLRKRWELRPR